MTRPVEFYPEALEHVQDVCAVAKVLSAHVRAAQTRDVRREIVVQGSRLRYRVDSEQITVWEATPVEHGES